MEVFVGEMKSPRNGMGDLGIEVSRWLGEGEE